MENASKALIIAASVLLGVMIISIGVVLFQIFSGFSADNIKKMEEKQISEFNSSYLKYYGTITYTDKTTNKEATKPIEVTAHDIISVANNAKQNNSKYELTEQRTYAESSYYIQVQVNRDMNFEKATEEEYSNFLKENSLNQDNETKYYICKEVKISSLTKRVIFVKFEEYK